MMILELLAGATAGSWVVGHPDWSADQGHPAKEGPRYEVVVGGGAEAARRRLERCGGQSGGRRDGGDAESAQSGGDLSLRFAASNTHTSSCAAIVFNLSTDS